MLHETTTDEAGYLAGAIADDHLVDARGLGPFSDDDESSDSSDDVVGGTGSGPRCGG